MFPGDQDCDLTETNPARLACAHVESTFLPLFGVQPIIGRNFTTDEDRNNAPRVALLSYNLWRTRYGGQAGVLGLPISLDNTPARIIGVLPKDFVMPTLSRFDILLPQQLNEAAQVFPKNGTTLRTFARLRPGWTPAQAACRAPSLLRTRHSREPRRLSQRNPHGRAHHPRLAKWRPPSGFLGPAPRRSRRPVARVHERRQSPARTRHQPPARTRHASSARCQPWTSRPPRHHRKPSAQPLRRDVRLRSRSASASKYCSPLPPTAFLDSPRSTSPSASLSSPLCCLLLSGLVFGALPAFRHPTLEIFTGWRSTSPAKTSMRDALVTLQIAGSLIMLTAAGLMLRTLWKLESVPLGLDTEHVVTAQFTLGSSYDTTSPARFLRNARTASAASARLDQRRFRRLHSSRRRHSFHTVLRYPRSWASALPARRRRHGAVARRVFRLFPIPSTFACSKAAASMLPIWEPAALRR